MTAAAAAEAAQQEQFGGATIQEVEEFLRHNFSWGNLMTRLICIFLGIFMSFYGALASGVTRADRVAINVVSCVLLLLGAGLICWDVYVRVHLEYFLEMMRAAADLDLRVAC